MIVTLAARKREPGLRPWADPDALMKRVSETAMRAARSVTTTSHRTRVMRASIGVLASLVYGEHKSDRAVLVRNEWAATDVAQMLVLNWMERTIYTWAAALVVALVSCVWDARVLVCATDVERAARFMEVVRTGFDTGTCPIRADTLRIDVTIGEHDKRAVFCRSLDAPGCVAAVDLVVWLGASGVDDDVARRDLAAFATIARGLGLDTRRERARPVLADERSRSRRRSRSSDAAHRARTRMRSRSR